MQTRRCHIIVFISLLLAGVSFAVSEMLSLEIQALEEELYKPKPAPPPPKPPAAPPAPIIAKPPPPKPPRAPVEPFDIKRLQLAGEPGEDAADRLGEALEGKVLSEEDVWRELERIRQRLIAQGYYAARVQLDGFDRENGTLSISTDLGQVGNLSLFELPDRYKDMTAEGRNTSRQPYKGHFSQPQLRSRLKGMQEGENFNYNHVFRDLFALNSVADLTVHSDLKIREEREGEELGHRYVDMDFYVEDRLPMHAIAALNNTGTEGVGDDYRMTLKLQHLNLTRHFDALTFVLPLSLDLRTSRSFSASYILPFDAGKGGGFSLFGGYSELDVKHVVDDIDLKGSGWFIGPRLFYHLRNDGHHLLNVAGGFMYRSVDDAIIFGDETVQTTAVDVLPVSLGLTYNNIQPDGLGGRNFLSALVTYNLGETLGVTATEDVAAQRESADADYTVVLLAASRIQTLGGTVLQGEAERSGEWYLFGSAGLQWTPGVLIPAEQKIVGGQDTVRGYPESAVAGDIGITGRLELRTPIYRGALTRLVRRNATYEKRKERPLDYLQAVAFIDGAYLDIKDHAPGLPADHTLLGTGVGFRLSLGDFSQFKVDYGVQLEEIEGLDPDNRVHLSLEVQF
jgi:hemolysin activation/secretion protein